MVLTECPELRERTSRYLSGELPGLEDDMRRRRVEMRALTLRMPSDLVAKADELAPRLQAHRETVDPFAVGGRQATAADVLRAALARGIDALDKELPKVSPPSPLRTKRKK